MKRLALLVPLIMGCGGKDSIAPPVPVIPELAGDWSVTFGAANVGFLELWQDESDVTGVMLGSLRLEVTGDITNDDVTLVFWYPPTQTDPEPTEAFRFEGHADTDDRLEGVAIGYSSATLNAVLVKQAKVEGMYPKVHGEWVGSWVDAEGSWTVSLFFQQVQDEFYTSGTLYHTSTPFYSLGIGMPDPINHPGTVTFAGALATDLELFQTEPDWQFRITGTLADVRTIDAVIHNLSAPGSSQVVTLRK